MHFIINATQVSRQEDVGFTTAFTGDEYAYNNYTGGVKGGRARIPVPPKYKEVGISGLKFKVYNFYLPYQFI